MRVCAWVEKEFGDELRCTKRAIKVLGDEEPSGMKQNRESK